MTFKLVLVPQRPGEVVLSAETPLRGLALLEKAAACLRRNLDTVENTTHQTLGALSSYTITVPQAIAIESKFFANKSEAVLVVENNILSKYIFYGAAISNMPAQRACYPYYKNTVTVISYIDELAFLDNWRNRGYPTTLTVSPIM